MTVSKCYSCGCEYHWDWTEAFYKFGFNDGDGQVMTEVVKYCLEIDGYTVKCKPWGCHNYVIYSVKKGNKEFIPYDYREYEFGSDDPRKYFPEDLIALLDREFPKTPYE